MYLSLYLSLFRLKWCPPTVTLPPQSQFYRHYASSSVDGIIESLYDVKVNFIRLNALL
ncbi:hypothetical protein LY78DRAFT_663151, partial [Colletotrichum sublineola]